MKKPVRIFGIILILALLGSTGYLGYRYRQLHSQKAQLLGQLGNAQKELQTFKTNPDEANKAETKKIVADVNKLYALPKEDPSVVYTVKDKVLAQKEPLFAKAETGDIALIYSTAKLAVLYRPTDNKIINVSTVTIQDTPPAAPATP